MSSASTSEFQVHGHGGAVAGAGTGVETEKMEVDAVAPPPGPEQGHHLAGDAVDAAVPLLSPNSNQLTLLFQGEVYVFDSVTPEKVQAVLLLLGGCEVPTGVASVSLSGRQDDRGYDDILRRTNIPAKRIASLIRFREKRKERNFDKKIRYTVRKEVALRMQRRRGQFAGKASPEVGPSAATNCNPPHSSSQDDPPQESKCQNCGISEKDTPAMRRGPAGPRSLCNACGLMWANKGTLRNLSRAKIGTLTAANPNEHGEAIDSDLMVDKKALAQTLNNHNSVMTSAAMVAEGIQADVPEETGEDLKTES